MVILKVLDHVTYRQAGLSGCVVVGRLTDSTACAAFRTNEQRSVWPTLPETHAGIRLVLLSVSVSSSTMSNSLLGLAIAIDQKSSDVAIASKQTKSHIKVLPLQPVGTRVIRIALG